MTIRPVVAVYALYPVNNNISKLSPRCRPKKSTHPVVFMSKIRGRASQFFIMLVPPIDNKLFWTSFHRNLQTLIFQFHTNLSRVYIREIHTVWSEIDITFRLISNKTINRVCKVWLSVSMYFMAPLLCLNGLWHLAITW